MNFETREFSFSPYFKVKYLDDETSENSLVSRFTIFKEFPILRDIGDKTLAAVPSVNFP